MFLIDDSEWIYQDRNKNNGEIPECTQLRSSNCSYDELDGHCNNPPKQKQCESNICIYIHQRLAWYNHAGGNLTSITLSSIFSEIPIRDAYYLIIRISKSGARLRKLDIGEFCNLSEQDTAKLVDGLKHLIPVAIPSLQVLVFNTQFGSFLDVFRSYCISNIKTVHLVLDGDDYESCLKTGICLLQHLEGCNAEVTALIVDGHGWQFEQLNRLMLHCPFLDVVELHADHFYGPNQFQFPVPQELTSNKASKLIIKGACIDRDHMIRVAEYVKATANINEFELQFCSTTFLSAALEICGKSFGEKVTCVDMFDSEENYKAYNEQCTYDGDLVAKMHEYCTNLKVLRLELNNNRFNETRTMGSLLQKLEHLKEVCIHSSGDYGGMTTEIINGLKYSSSKIEIIYLNQVMLSMQEVWLIMDYTSYSLKSFRMTYDNYSIGEVLSDQDDYEIMKNVLRILRDVYNNPSLFQHLREFMIPIGSLSTVYNDELKTMGRKITEVLQKMLRRFVNYFDIQRAIIHMNEILNPDDDEDDL